MSREKQRCLSRRDFRRIIENRRIMPLEQDERMCNLAQGYWVYDELIADLRRTGWIRFGPGFKAGVYGHPHSDYCIKLMGMGVGQNPLYFCERGYYIDHERKMISDFREAGFHFSPAVLSQEDSVDFLIRACGVSADQAEMRVNNNDLLLTEYIPGIPLATQTGYALNYDLNIDAFSEEVVEEMCSALQKLWISLHKANNRSLLLHNDPMPPNIIFTLDENDIIVARLVDFELAQNLQKSSPEYVNCSVEELYRERRVPVDPLTRTHISNLDQHLLDGSISIARRVHEAMRTSRDDDSFLNALSVGISFIGGITLNVGKTVNVLKRLIG